MPGKKMYSDELKLEIVLNYHTGKYSIADLAKKYYVHRSDVLKWIAAYREHGVGVNIL